MIHCLRTMNRGKSIPILAFACVLAGSSFVLGETNLYSIGLDEKAVQEKRVKYPDRLKALEEYRKKQAERYGQADAPTRAAILQETRKHLEIALLQDVFPAWYGTDWAFSGTSTKPGEGSIACGYFVSTCLTQVGFKVSRTKLAQQASQGIIETFMAKSERDVFAGGKSMEFIKGYLKKKGDGLYIVGLDSHVGFVSVSGDDMAFIHSSYYEPDSFVVAEKIDTKNPLSDSKYRVFGKILSDDMILGWLTQREYPVKTN